MNRVFVLGDPHGGYRALVQVLRLCNFNKDTDTLIVLGDVVDGWPETVELINELLTIKNLIIIMGNHDFWCYNWMRYGWRPDVWVRQGGQATLDSYKYDGLVEREKQLKLIVRHKVKYFEKANLYYKDEHRNLYVHGGFTQELGNDSQDTYMWDRSLWDKAKSAKKTQLKLTKPFNKVFIGHTSLGNSEPLLKGGNVWNLDTGGGWEGKLTIMDVNTEEYWQSDLLNELYPEISEMRGFKIKK